MALVPGNKNVTSCKGCSVIISINNNMKCKHCFIAFCLKCAEVSSHYYYNSMLMEEKDNWACRPCSNQPIAEPKNESPTYQKIAQEVNKAIQNFRRELKKETDELHEETEYLKSEIEKLQTRTDSLKIEIDTLKRETEQIQDKLKSTREMSVQDEAGSNLVQEVQEPLNYNTTVNLEQLQKYIQTEVNKEMKKEKDDWDQQNKLRRQEIKGLGARLDGLQNEIGQLRLKLSSMQPMIRRNSNIPTKINRRYSEQHQ